MKWIFGFLIALSVLALWLWSTIIEPYFCIKYDNVEVKSPTLFEPMADVKIAVVSDIHFGNSVAETWRLNKIIETANAANADIILLLGDYVSAATPFGQINLDILTHNLKKLRAPLGVYAIMGNHDSYYALSLVRKSVENAGITILENSSIEIKTPQGSLYLAGIADAFTQNYYLVPTFKDIPEDKPAILLSHSPDVFREAPSQVKLMFSGHTHGGQIKFPKFGAIFVNLMVERIAEGKVVRGDKTLYVTRGLGTSRIPVRFLCSPAITIVKISK